VPYNEAMCTFIIQIFFVKALLIIDMQRGSFIADTPRHDADGVIDRINKLANSFRKQGDLVLFIQHDGTDNDNFLPGSEEWMLLPELELTAADGFIAKTANDCFYRSGLNTILQEHHATEVVITGCATDFCVDATVKSAATQGYSVVVIADGHTTTNHEDIAAGQLIAHYNWVWKNMLPVAGKNIAVVACDGYLSEPVNV
jgi:nicotinamidase-related amidase